MSPSTQDVSPSACVKLLGELASYLSFFSVTVFSQNNIRLKDIDISKCVLDTSHQSIILKA